MLITRENFSKFLNHLINKKEISIDTETTGLRWWENDRLFSIIISDGAYNFYLNFNKEPDHLGNKTAEDITLDYSYIENLNVAIARKDMTWYVHNAKFDLGMLTKEGLCLAGNIHCTEAMSRLLYSQAKSHSLDNCVKMMAKDLGEEIPLKSDAVKKYCNKHKLYRKINLKGKKKAITEYHYHKVPFDIMYEYAMTDAEITFALGVYQKQQINSKIYHGNFKLERVYELEKKTTLSCFEMEKSGLLLDKEFTQKSLEVELENIKNYRSEYLGITGKEFTDSPNSLAAAFDDLGLEYPTTAKGNPSFSKDSLNELDNPIANIIKDIRGSEKRCGSYFSSFIYYQSKSDGAVHPSIRQTGAETSRMSITSPSMQNIPKKDGLDDDSDEINPEVVRRCFKPFPDYVLFSPDYDQMEYRMMLDMAEEMDMIKLIREGLDVHQATAEMVHISRTQAKTVNFMLLYGGGAEKLADNLGISKSEAREIIIKYYSRLKNVKKWKNKIIKHAQDYGSIRNWMGREYKIYYSDAYKACNYVIQGGCAEVVKRAMWECKLLLEGKKSKMSLQIHDELLFNIHKDELDLCPKIVEIMEQAYPYKHLPLTVGPSYSWKSWGDKLEGFPVPLSNGEKTGDPV